MKPGITATKFGRRLAPEPPHFDRLVLYRGETLHTTDFEPPIPVLDQEDLLEQDIHTSQFIPGAQDVDALGSCVANGSTASLAERLAAAHGTAAVSVGVPTGLETLSLSLQDAAADERFAIALYHLITDQTGDPAEEWPPSDCGSTGYAACQELMRLGFITNYQSAQDMHALAMLLQTGSVIIGMPWFNAWMEPDANGFVDGDGTVVDLERAIASGVAGGHETCISALERVTLTGMGLLDLPKCHVRVRNSWSKGFGDSGSYRIHLSTFDQLGAYADYKQFVIAA